MERKEIVNPVILLTVLISNSLSQDELLQCTSTGLNRENLVQRQTGELSRD